MILGKGYVGQIVGLIMLTIISTASIYKESIFGAFLIAIMGVMLIITNAKLIYLHNITEK